MTVSRFSKGKERVREFLFSWYQNARERDPIFQRTAKQACTVSQTVVEASYICLFLGSSNGDSSVKVPLHHYYRIRISQWFSRNRNLATRVSADKHISRGRLLRPT